MCGIAGLIVAGRVPAGLPGRMAAAIAHRGPDDEGIWADETGKVVLVHRRLAIVDLSPHGHQPMVSADGRYVLVYNGEIYNHAELRRRIEEREGGMAWRGHSDTETLLECIAAWGLEAALAASVGMFALALWDRSEQTLKLARDRFGEKPLYYGWVGGDFVFASELKAIRCHPGFANGIDRRALRLYTSRGYVPAPLSIYEDIYKLPPGTVLTTGLQAPASHPSSPPTPDDGATALTIRSYWSYAKVLRAGLANPIGSKDEALERLESTLAGAVRSQSIADVPVGTFLSGGIDSSLVVGLHQKFFPGQIRTFTIGFEDKAFDEAGYASAVARQFGTDHHEHIVTVREAQDIIPLLPRIYDEPFADSSQIPTCIVSRFAREQVTVALSGDGADELFGGYNRYIGSARVWAGMKRLPKVLRSGAGSVLRQVPPPVWNELAALLPQGRRSPQFGAKVQKTFRSMTSAEGLDDVFASFLDEWSGEQSPVIGGELPHALAALDLSLDAPDTLRMMYCDAVSYLPDDILCKVDRAAMAVSLETRAPFLDHRVAELAARIPIEMKIGGGVGKLVLRDLLYRHAPAALFERPKAGFAVPVGEWIKGPLRDWAEALIEPGLLRQQGYFDPAIVHRRWQQHLSGERDSTAALWAVLMFQGWLAEQANQRLVIA